MNRWDIFTYAMCFVLSGSAVVIFTYFLKDVRTILNRKLDDNGDDSSLVDQPPDKDEKSHRI